MKEVVVHPERCVGCMQCAAACATAHSQSKRLVAAALEVPQPRPRIHLGAGLYREGFPNRCRHCDPAPCLVACPSNAVSRLTATNTVMIDPDRCINCATCAMACPFGVIRYHQDHAAAPGKVVAAKCDNCTERREQGQLPACVEICKSHALTFEESDEAHKRTTDAVARKISLGLLESELAESESFALLCQLKKIHQQLSERIQ